MKKQVSKKKEQREPIPLSISPLKGENNSRLPFKGKLGGDGPGRICFLFFVFYLLLLTASDAHAMHISDGILPLEWSVFWFAAALPFVGYGLRRVRKISEQDLSYKPLVGLMAAVVFVISSMPIPVPFAGTSSHLCGTGISAVLLGPVVSVVISAAALLVQTLLLGHGGLSAWGAHIVSMGAAGSFAGYGAFRMLRSAKINLAAAGFAAGVIADWATYLMTSVQLASGIRGESAFAPFFSKVAVAFIPTQLPLGLLEGAITAGMLALLSKKRPELLVRVGVVKAIEGN